MATKRNAARNLLEPVDKQVVLKRGHRKTFGHSVVWIPIHTVIHSKMLTKLQTSLPYIHTF